MSITIWWYSCLQIVTLRRLVSPNCDPDGTHCDPDGTQSQNCDPDGTQFQNCKSAWSKKPGMWPREYSGNLDDSPGVCITTAIWHCHKPFSQWQRSFQMKAALPLAEMLATALHYICNVIECVTLGIHAPLCCAFSEVTLQVELSSLDPRTV